MRDFDDVNSKGAKILFVSEYLPYPLDNGIKIRAFHTLKELLIKGHKVTLICFTKDDNNHIQDLKKKLNIEIYTVELKKGNYPISHIFYTIFSRYPFYMKFLFQDEFKEKLKSLIRTNSFDLLYVYDRYMVLYGKDILNIPKILDSVDSQSLNSLSGFESSKNIFHKIFWYINYIKSKKLEKTLYNSYDYIITAAERDANQLKGLTNSKIVNIPNGVDINYFKPMNLRKIPYSLAFLGTMDAFSNQQAVLYFVEEVYPAIKQSFPSVKLFIIGKNPPRDILNLSDGKNIFVTGYVEDVRSCLDKCKIIISPLKMASGIQNKILVAMAMNKPIVSTKESIGEINSFITDEDIIVVKDSDEFAQKIIKLLFDDRLLNKVGKNGRNIVKKNYSWESLGYKIDKLIKKSCQ